MDTTTLGRTGLNVSVAVLGAGGSSRLGMKNGATQSQAAELVRMAIDHGITMIDTAANYGTEGAVGEGVEGRRDQVVISTKARCHKPGTPLDSLDFVTREELRGSVETSLKNLRTDYVDILHLHGIRPHQYDYCLNELVPELQRLQEEGKVRFLGITEAFGVDLEHVTMKRAVADGVWDVLMLGFNYVNHSNAREVLPAAQEKNLGVMAMYAVRGALARKETLDNLVRELIEKGEVSADIAGEVGDLTSLLVQGGVAGTLTEAAYRFCRHAPGISVVLTGTGKFQHLEQNIASIKGAPLPAEVTEKLHRMFGNVVSATGDL